MRVQMMWYCATDEIMRATLMCVSVEVVIGVRIVQCHAIINVAIGVRVMHYHAIIDVVIGVRASNHVQSTIMNFPLLVPILILLSDCINSSSLFLSPFCTHFCTAKICHLRCGIYRSRSCSTTAIGVQSGSFRLGSRGLHNDLLDAVLEPLKLESELPWMERHCCNEPSSVWQ